MNDSTPKFRGGRNVAMKLPPHQYEKTLTFYRDTLGLNVTATSSGYSVDFGPIRLWLDRCPQFSQAELWLDIVTDDTHKAMEHLSAGNVTRCDEVEPLPEGFDGFWVSNPAGIVHIVKSKAD